MLTHVLRRAYQSVPGSRARVIDCLSTHIEWLRRHRPSYVALYFKNNWNPECSDELQSEFLKATAGNPFETFIVDGTMGTIGERTKKYYCVRYEPTFLLLADGMEAKRIIGSDIQVVKQAIADVRLFRNNVSWDFGLDERSDLWEDFHDEYMKEWRQHRQQETVDHDGTVVFDRS